MAGPSLFFRRWTIRAVLGFWLPIGWFLVSPVPVSAGPALAKQAMIAAANPWAVDAGIGALQDGGNAVDAAIAAQLVLNVVEPQSSGIGGGAFLLYYDATSGSVRSYDGRETAPMSATPDLFIGLDGKPMRFFDAVVGGKSVGIPGLVAMLELAHKRHGKLSWQRLFSPAIRLAANGFKVSLRLHAMIKRDRHLKTFQTARRYFYDGLQHPRPVGWRLRNRSFAETLRKIADGGADAFYRGEIADEIIATVNSAPRYPARIGRQDFADYRAREREPVCASYRQYTVCGMPPPTSGGLTLLQILIMLERFDMAALEPSSSRAVHLISEASRLAFADRSRYMADADFVPVPVHGLLDRDYLGGRAALIRESESMGRAIPGKPLGQLTQRWGHDASLELPSTTHLSVVDSEGNAVAMTSSIENAFGSRLMAGGFLLNNELTDFSFLASRDGAAVANRIEPGKRPRSSMSPTIVLNADGSLRLAIGSPGGSRIIPYVAKTIIAVLDWGLDVQAAINLPHHTNRNGSTDLEKSTSVATIAPTLEALGHKVKVRRLNSGLHGIERLPAGLRGGADPRREGVARGF